MVEALRLQLQQHVERWMGWREPEADGAFGEVVEAIADAESTLQGLDDRGLQDLAASLRQRARAGMPLDALVVETFALVREAARRCLGWRLYDVQILCGLALHHGKIAEMKTGEGKTLAAVAPSVLHSWGGHGVHVLTHNDYLARRDALWMGPVYEFLGLTVGCVQEGMDVDARREAYRQDVTYLTAKEAGFDLLRDQLCLDPAYQVHRDFHFALVDEADSILIDEARIPLVIAGSARPGTERLQQIDRTARQLVSAEDFDIDVHAHNIFLTERGAHRAESLLGCGNLYAPENSGLMADLRNALHAHALLRKDVDYIVREGTIELIDEFTGRVAENRHWPDGLHSAVEVKEGVRQKGEGDILGSITVQSFLSLYPHLCGMTGTARSAAREWLDLYDLGVVEIPTHRPFCRMDEADRVFATRQAKYRALVEEIDREHRRGRPILVGTVSIRESEELAGCLAEASIPCRVLNAKNREQEARIIAEAGALGAVTISTNMAGRGTDIRLGGADESDRDRVVELGGLYVLGTNRHESQRIDDQLRGRAGRQGDPGTSRFFVSLEDDLLERYRVREQLPRVVLSACGEGEIDHPLVRREIVRAQRLAEGESGDIRKRLGDYGDLVEKQRLLISEWRQSILEGTQRLDLLQRSTESARRWVEVHDLVGGEVLEQVERRVSLVIVDRCFSEHLAALQRLRDELPFIQLDGRTPLVEFCRIAQDAFEELLDDIDQQIIEAFLQLEISEDGVDWEASGLTGPSATWTYLVSDNLFANNALMPLANHASFAVLGVAILWPVLFVWGLVQHWRNRRRTPMN